MPEYNWTNCPICNEEELREDCDFYLNGETLEISYKAKCTICNFKFTYSKNINIITGEEVEHE